MGVADVSSSIDQDNAEGVWWSMGSELLWFAIGFGMFRILIALGVAPALGLRPRMDWLEGVRRGHKKEQSVKQPAAFKSMVADASAGHFDSVIKAWRLEQGREGGGGPAPLDALQGVAQALASLTPESLIAEVTAYLRQHVKALARPATVQALLEGVLQVGRADLAQALAEAAEEALHLPADVRSRETLLAGFAAEGDEKKVDELAGNTEVTTRGCFMIVKGFLKSGKVEAAVARVLEMQKRGVEVPPRATLEIFRTSAAGGSVAVSRTLDSLVGHVPLTAEVVALLMDKCLQWENFDLATRLERLAEVEAVPLNYGAYEPLLKLHAMCDSNHAAELFESMETNGFFATEGFCGSLLARCAESQNMRLTEVVAGYLRRKSMTTLATYKTLMKVYASCGLYDRACDLHEELLQDGHKPDRQMCGCLVKFAVKCGRSDLSQKLFEQVEGGDIQNYMWLIRAAGRDGNASKALALLRRLETEAPERLDVAVYNAVMDACVTSGELRQAQKLFEEMRESGLPNLITHNTLMKGHCMKGDLVRARRTLLEMEAGGIAPDAASYNCLISATVSAGRHADVWELVAEMAQRGLPRDRYMLSIMMKAARTARNSRDACRALAVLDDEAVDVCEDDILFNTVLDACIYCRDLDRLAWVLSAYAAAKLRPSVHTYGLLIKASSLMKDAKRCWELWREMVEKRGLVPNEIALSCMIDALVCGGTVNQAVHLLDEWRDRVPPNTVMYATLIKGFAAEGNSERALAVYKELRGAGLQMTLVAYTSLIDAHAKAGLLEEAEALLQQMDKDGCHPNTITYSTLVRGHCQQGDLLNAMRLFKEMLGRGLAADTIIFNMMLDGCVKNSNWGLADQLLADMTMYSVEPSNFTLSIMVKMWGKRRCLEEAFEAVRRSLSGGRMRLDAQVGTCLVGACLHNGAVDRALEAFDEVKTWPQCAGPDAGTYGALISGLANAGRLQEAVKFAEEACSRATGPRPPLKPLGPATLGALFKALKRNGLDESLGRPLQERLAAAGISLPETCRSADGRAELHRRGPVGRVRNEGRRAH